jgi:hypothetical protein
MSKLFKLSDTVYGLFMIICVYICEALFTDKRRLHLDKHYFSLEKLPEQSNSPGTRGPNFEQCL